jgi:hypothetical protein
MLPFSKLALKMTFNLFLTQRFFALVKTTEYTTSFPSGSGIALLILLNLRPVSFEGFRNRRQPRPPPES